MAISAYQNYQRRLPASPDPQQVGQLLAQQSQNGPGAGDEAESVDNPSEDLAETGTLDSLASEPDPHQLAAGSDWPSSAEAALRAAILRAPSKVTGQNQAPPNAMSRLQLQRMGIPDAEIDLLNLTGGANTA